MTSSAHGARRSSRAPDRTELWRRYLRLLVDGIRAEGTAREPLADPPLGLECIQEVMVRWRPPRRA